MKLQIDGNPDYGQLRVQLGPGESFIAEGGAMAWMDSRMSVRARLLGGLGRALIRKLTGGESLFVGEYATDRGGEVVFSPASPGAVVQRTMSGQDTITLTAGSFFACTPGIELQHQVRRTAVASSRARASSSWSAAARASCSSTPSAA